MVVRGHETLDMLHAFTQGLSKHDQPVLGLPHVGEASDGDGGVVYRCLQEGPLECRRAYRGTVEDDAAFSFRAKITKNDQSG